MPVLTSAGCQLGDVFWCCLGCFTPVPFELSPCPAPSAPCASHTSHSGGLRAGAIRGSPGHACKIDARASMAGYGQAVLIFADPLSVHCGYSKTSGNPCRQRVCATPWAHSAVQPRSPAASRGCTDPKSWHCPYSCPSCFAAAIRPVGRRSSQNSTAPRTDRGNRIKNVKREHPKPLGTRMGIWFAGFLGPTAE